MGRNGLSSHKPLFVGLNSDILNWGVCVRNHAVVLYQTCKRMLLRAGSGSFQFRLRRLEATATMFQSTPGSSFDRARGRRSSV